MTIRRVPEITAEQENFRVERIGGSAGVVRRDPVEPVPVGTLVARVFRVTGYDQDCDGSLMARLAAVDDQGRETGWQVTHVGVYPSDAWVLDSPDELDSLS